MNHLMKFDPTDGSEKPYPSEAGQYRGWHGRVAWLFNPWTGEKRHPADIGSDVTGLLIRAPGEVLKQAKLPPVLPYLRCMLRPVFTDLRGYRVKGAHSEHGEFSRYWATLESNEKVEITEKEFYRLCGMDDG